MHKKKFLIIDDEQDILDLLNYNLSKEGYSITLAQNGLEGLDKINSDIDLIILDVMMPKMDGLEFCKHVKSKKKLQNIPIIFLTAKDDEIDEIIGLEIGADDNDQTDVDESADKATLLAGLSYKCAEGITFAPNMSQTTIGDQDPTTSINLTFQLSF